MDMEILAAVGTNIIGDKVKDAFPGRSWKVNVYRDAGSASVNRLKIDLDRDEKWDEKWSWEPEGIKRQVAPADNEKYTEETWYHPDAKSWKEEKPLVTKNSPRIQPVSEADAQAAVSPPPGAVPMRPMDAEILSLVATGIAGGKGKDAVPGRSWKVNLYQDPGNQSVNRLKIDLDRDEKWDEKWSWEPDGLQRQMAPNDDEVYSQKMWFRPDLQVWVLTKPRLGGVGIPAEGAGGIVPLSSAPVAPHEPGEGELRAMDSEILDVAGKNIAGDKVKDAVRGRSWKVNLYKDSGSATVNRVKIDLDRDDKWDEKWTWEKDGILREVAPNDDEVFLSKQFLPSGGRKWLPR
jgi:hypothetical protein